MSPRIRLVPLAALVAVAAIVALVFIPRGGRADTAGPSPIARAMPSGAVAYLESDDLRGALGIWKSSALRASWETSDANDRMGRSMLFLRLAERLQALELIAGIELDVDALSTVAGRRAGIALYDLSDTVFVLQAQLPSADLAQHPLTQARKRFDARRHAGVEYFIAKDATTGAELAFAFVGARLIVSNSNVRLGDALLLAAREEKVKTDKQPGASLADDKSYAELVAASATTAHVRIYVDLGALRGTHQFDDFWIFGGNSRRLDGVSGALLTLFADKGELVETRTLAYSDVGQRPSVGQRPNAGGGTGAGDAGGGTGTGGAGGGTKSTTTATGADIPWPKLGFVEDLTTTDAPLAADRIARLLPSISLDGERGKPLDVTGRIAAALTDAAPIRAYEAVIVDTVKARLAPRRGRAGVIAIRLRAADKLDRKALETAIVDHLRWIASDGAPVPMAFDANGTLRIPLVDDVTPTIVVDGDLLIVATDPALAKKASVGALLADSAPVGSRLDVTIAAARWDDLASVVGKRADWLDTADREFVVDVIPGLLHDTGAKSITTTGFIQGPHYVEHVRYR